MNIKAIKPELVEKWCRATGSTNLTYGTPYDMFKDYCIGIGISEGSLTDVEARWLRSMGATGYTIHDLWTNFLTEQGYSPSEDGMRSFFDGTVAVAQLFDDSNNFIFDDSSKLIYVG